MPSVMTRLSRLAAIRVWMAARPMFRVRSPAKSVSWPGKRLCVSSWSSVPANCSASCSCASAGSTMSAATAFLISVAATYGFMRITRRLGSMPTHLAGTLMPT